MERGMDRVRERLRGQAEELGALALEERVDPLRERGLARADREAHELALQGFYRLLGMEEEIARDLDGLDRACELAFYPDQFSSRGFFRDNSVHNNNVL